ncbi:hypothetical protein COT75_03885 [Candidatus Beckwithbacteria bacterium CG10_big_fil_rev_8_21_14_0_10_34_10]|uniref:Maf-like protein n=1 Tax=Candidatus Beckwithbacteria bacterium CG10_big_fil_rev_8_21_14_0_10_34_10 TaxID=1974495 RepID=A0A2H0W8M4_9BACT|nr:MAG: hypothetical protein COT75_03885 [Candidatus Beckwithbacteria bacterium CG10_big_fil_rev_8_21_14_0_10_34_10]
MKIIICGSLTATNKILEIKSKLEAKGHQVEIPYGSKNSKIIKRVKNRKVIVDVKEAEEKIKYNLLKKYYELIKQHEVVLVVNPEKKGIKGYIGGNTLMEMGFGYVLGKKIYCLYPLPKMSYTAELLAMKPIILNGKINKLINSNEKK